MSRYIEYDDAIERLGAYLMAAAKIRWGNTASWDNDANGDIEDWKRHASDILKYSPSVDIVRCKDCKHAHMTNRLCKYCDEWKDEDGTLIEVYHDMYFYCGYGERKEE